ncbi:MAG: hypothetical protein PHC88_00710 [Terrimicrobiaceae bacterium]|nr:hypothetical protein [Terrimicrobiaceae bacterium]
MRTSHRNYEQSMGLWINEPLLLHPEEIDRSIHELADAGYDTVRLFVRHSNFTLRCPEVVEAVRRAVKTGHERGMRLALDCEPHELVGRDMGRQFPGEMSSKLLRQSVQVVDGHWIMRVEPPSLGGYVGAPLDGVEAAYLRVEGNLKKIGLGDHTVSRGFQWYRNGNVHRELFYREGVPASPHPVHELRGCLPGSVNGELIVYLRFSVRTVVDFWSEGCRRYYEELLECYRDIPLDGVGWDEPAVAGDWKCYHYGAGFAAAFERLNGYALTDRLYLLDEPGMSAEAAKVRLDYYRTLNEGLARAQANLIAKARSLFGKDLLLGTHHTWQGEAGINDYRSGAVDYFRLNDCMDAGYTDVPQWDPESVAYAYTLGSSLGRLTPSGEAEVNTWHWMPTVSNIHHNVNLMTLMNITWFNIWFGRDCDCVMQQGHYTWPTTVAYMQRHREFQRQIGKRRPVADVAIWHGWEGVCAWNKASLANTHKTFCLNTSRLLIDRSVAADFIDSRLLAGSRIENGRLVNDLGSYRVLVMPYALVLPGKAFEVCAAFSRAGGRVIFVGTPVAADDQGCSLTDAFAGLLGIPPMTAEHYMAGLDAVCTMPDCRLQRLEVCRPLAAGLPRALVSCEGETHGVVSEEGNAVFLTDLDPQERLLERIEDALSDDVQAHGSNLLWRLYRGEEGDLLVVVAREDRPLRGMVRWQGRLIELTDGSVGLFEIRGGELSVKGDVVWKPLSI